MLRSLRIAVGVVLAASASSGCPRRSVPEDVEEIDGPASDIASDRRDVRVDAPPSDRDGDGLCDDTEMRIYRTDPDNPDSDGDGLLDGFEVEAYYRPLSATDPPGDIVFHMREQPGEYVIIPYEMYYRGNGESLTGLLFDRLRGPETMSVLDLNPDIVAVRAEPRSNVEDIAGSRFIHVVDTVFLRWEVTIRWPTLPPLGCRRAYMFWGAAFADERGTYFSRAMILDVQGIAVRDFDAGSVPPDASAVADGGIERPWPHVRRGFCLPAPTPCR